MRAAGLQPGGNSRAGPNPSMASEVNGMYRERWKFFLLPRRYNRTAGDPSLFGCVGDVHAAVSARSCTKHFSKGRPPRPSAGRGDCGGLPPRPRPKTSVSPWGPKYSDKGERGRSMSGSTAVDGCLSRLSVIHAALPFLGLAPMRVEASGPRHRLLGLKGSAAGAAPPHTGTAGPPTGSIAKA